MTMTRLEIDEELKKCVKCGACMAVCPIYRQTGREDMVARGKLNLIEIVKESKELPLGWLEAVDHCLLCCSCEENCSKGVKITEVIAAARVQQTEIMGLNHIKKWVFALLKNRIFSIAGFVKLGSLGQWLLWRRLPRHSGLVRRLPLPGFDEKTVIPALPKRNLDDLLRRRQPAPGLEPILFFPGCATRYLHPGMGVDLIFVLEKLGFRAVIPPEFKCCGLVTWGAGDEATSLQLRQANLKVLHENSDIRQLVTGCASCGHALKEYDGLPQACEILDISEFLFQHREKLKDLLAGRKLKQKITYHDPCHLRKGQGITREPRWLLKLMAGDNFIEMRHPERCCGAGGTFGLTHKELSRKILKEKTLAADATGAEIVTSGCPGCILQLTEGAVVADSNWQAQHPLTLLANLLRKE